MQRFVNVTAKVCERHGKNLRTPRQKFVNAMANVCEHHGKSLLMPRQKFLNATAKVCERHGKSLLMPRQKSVNATAKACERHGKSLWTQRQKFVNTTAKVCEHYGKSLWKPRQKFVNTTAKGFENWKKPRRKLALERKRQHSRQSWPNRDPGNKVWSRYGDSEEVAISDELNKAFTYDEILALLDEYHGAPFFPHGSFGIQFSKQGFNSRAWNTNTLPWGCAKYAYSLSCSQVHLIDQNKLLILSRTKTTSCSTVISSFQTVLFQAPLKRSYTHSNIMHRI